MGASGSIDESISPTETDTGIDESIEHLLEVFSVFSSEVNRIADNILKFSGSFPWEVVAVSKEEDSLDKKAKKISLGELLTEFILDDESRDVGISDFCYEKENMALNKAISLALCEKKLDSTKNSPADMKALCAAVREDAEDELELSKEKLERISTSLLSEVAIKRFNQRCKVINSTIERFAEKLHKMDNAEFKKNSSSDIEIMYRRSLNMAIRSVMRRSNTGVDTSINTLSNSATLMQSYRGESKSEIRKTLNNKYNELNAIPCRHEVARAKSKRMAQRRLQKLPVLSVQFPGIPLPLIDKVMSLFSRSRVS